MADGQQIEGVDYAFPPHPNIGQLAAAGIRFACRYGGPGTAPKHLTLSEAQALNAAGIAVVANAEGSANGLINGFAAGASWASDAEAHFRACGMPPGRPIYFSVDFDTTSGDWDELDSAMDGAASVIGRERVGVYGEYSIIEHFAANQKARWYWQTYAWSLGRWSSHNHIEQYHNGVDLAGADVDLNRAMRSDYGQWTVGGTDVDRSDVVDIWQHYLAPGGYNMQDHLLNAETSAAQANSTTKAILAEVAALRHVIEQLAAAIAAGGGTVDTAAILAGVDRLLTKQLGQIETVVDTELDEQSRAGADNDPAPAGS